MAASCNGTVQGLIVGKTHLTLATFNRFPATLGIMLVSLLARNYSSLSQTSLQNSCMQVVCKIFTYEISC